MPALHGPKANRRLRVGFEPCQRLAAPFSFRRMRDHERRSISHRGEGLIGC